MYLDVWHVGNEWLKIPQGAACPRCGFLESEHQASAAARAPEQEQPCANGHEWSNQFGDDWTPERGTFCDCRKKQWGIEAPAPDQQPQEKRT